MAQPYKHRPFDAVMREVPLGQRIFAPAYTRVTIVDREDEWDIVTVDLFFDPGYTHILSEDNGIDQFDTRQQARILKALNDQCEEDHLVRLAAERIGMPV